MEIKRISEDNSTGEFINVEFSDYATACDVALNWLLLLKRLLKERAMKK